MTQLNDYSLTIDLLNGTVPISKAAAALASLIKQAREQRRVVVLTQKGYPTAVLIDIQLYTLLQELAQRSSETPPDAAP